MSEQRKELPFQNLGKRLKTIRQKLQESVADVSGAVEIDETALQRIEQGAERPSEDILLLLISHFGMQDDDAANLWQLAGYDQPKRERDDRESSDEQFGNRAAVLIMAVDPRVIYTDNVQVSANPHGVTITFGQTGGSQPMTTARIGMSREQAKHMIHTLETALERSEPRQLPSSQERHNETSKDN